MTWFHVGLSLLNHAQCSHDCPEDGSRSHQKGSRLTYLCSRISSSLSTPGLKLYWIHCGCHCIVLMHLQDIFWNWRATTGNEFSTKTQRQLWSLWVVHSRGRAFVHVFPNRRQEPLGDSLHSGESDLFILRDLTSCSRLQTPTMPQILSLIVSCRRTIIV